jgi:uncharacterized protein YndB with AHSA1/START domain
MKADQKTNVIETEYSFDVDVETLFKAWTEADQLKKWWRPMENSLVDVVNDLKTGGAVEYHFGESGLQITGEYKEVIPNEKLVYTWVWNMDDQGSESGYVLNIGFSAEGEGSKLHIVQEGFSGPEHLAPHEEGWKKGLEDLSNYLSDTSNVSNESEGNSSSDESISTTDNLKSDEKMTDRSGGYNESPEQVKVGGG